MNDPEGGIRKEWGVSALNGPGLRLRRCGISGRNRWLKFPLRSRIDIMKDGRGFRSIFTRRGSGLTEREEVKASSVAASISRRVESGYPEREIVEAEDKALRKYSKRKALSDIWDRIRVLFFIAKNPKVCGLSIAVPAAVAVLYLVLPVDAVPDFLPGSGLLDDVFVATGMIGLIVKSAVSIPKEKVLEIRAKCPGDILSSFDSMFSIDASSVEKVEECVVTAANEKEARGERVAGRVEKAVRGAGKIISFFHSALDSAAFDDPAITKSRLYRAVKRTDSVISGAKNAAVKALEEVLKLMLMKKGIKSLLSFSAFALSLFFFSLKDDGVFFLVLSSLSMLLSYAFFIHSVIKNVPRIYRFLRTFFKDDLESAVVALLFCDSDENPGLKEALVRCGVRRIKNERDIQKILLKNFGRSLIIFLLEFMLIIVALFALKKVVLLTSGLTSSFQILFAPFVELFALFKSPK